MDRCALFVDAGYMLADGATAVHGTSSPDSVSWDYAGLLRLLASLSADRTGQQLLRCYWYAATADGRRTSEHDTLADLPGLTLRLARMRPGQREGVETDIHRDLTTLARNRAVSDVLLVSAEENLAQVIADVQDLGIRVMIADILVDGEWAVSRSLRQQCDDVVQIDRTQLQPYVELIVGAEPARYDQPYAVAVYGGKPLANGHAASAGGSGHSGRPSGFAQPQTGQPQTGQAQTSRSGPPLYTEPDPGPFRDPTAPALPGPPSAPPAQDVPAAQHGVPASAPVQAHPGPPVDPLRPARDSGQAAAGPSAVTPPAAPGRRAAGTRPPYAPWDAGSLTDPTADRGASAPPEQLTSAPPSLPTRRGGPANGLHRDSLHGDGLYGEGLHGDERYGDERYGDGLPVPQSPQPQPGPRGPQTARPAAATDYVPRQGSYDAQLPVPSTAGRAPAGGSLADTAATAHAEGFEFGKSVARDAPALWLEAVLARKPRMPSDLEARLLEGSALPTEALLRDEVRQVLRRGFWDALERSRR